MIAGVTALLGAFFQINPIWQFGSYHASNISYAVQPDWYMGWLDGALRIMPSWEWVGFGHTIPLRGVPARDHLPGDHLQHLLRVADGSSVATRRTPLMHNLLDRPRDRPKRTAAGAAMLGLLGMLFVASATDVLANFFHISLNSVLIAMRILVVVTPFVCYFVTWKICLEMQALPNAGRRKVANVVTLTEEGEYVATPMPPPPGTDEPELAPEFVPALLDLDGASGDGASRDDDDDDDVSFGTSSVRTVPR